MKINVRQGRVILVRGYQCAKKAKRVEKHSFLFTRKLEYQGWMNPRNHF